VEYGREELVYYVLAGSGVLKYGGKLMSITKDDFFYIPINTEHSFSTTQDELEMLVMGYRIPESTPIDTTAFQIATARHVEFQTLEQLNHGATSRFQLLLGTTKSTRDRLAVAYQINSLFVIEFDPGGTNIPHRHPNEEEIYYVLQGKGDMVAGETPEGEPRRHSVNEGDAFYFSENCLVGFYSASGDKSFSRTLAIRSKLPAP
jgi:mannose-6-phosphate isomerase-like protein (cupin superfamily)